MAIDRSTNAFRETEAIQTAVSDPAVSAWVSANAGSGKTHVLTNRVIRLLMGRPATGDGGARPSSILCITYTKAAAAEMQGRLFRILGDWALIDDEALAAALAERLGPDVDLPPLSEVRQLFARALDTPGGLRIQTIHSFCESLLRRFPVEAGLLPGFSVLDDTEVSAIRNRIAHDMAREMPAAPWRDAMAHLLDHFADLDAVMIAVTDKPFSDGMTGPDEIWQRLGLGPGADEEGIRRAAISSIDKRFLRALEMAHDEFAAEFASSNSKYDLQTRAAIEVLSASGAEDAALFERLCAAWLTKEGKAPKSLKGNQFVRGRIASYPDDAIQLCAHLEMALSQLSAVKIARLTEAVLTIAAEVRRRYAAAKAARGVVDFDDLITRAAALLKDVDGAWIRYKLDQGISHLLLDEAQDTGEHQWQVINLFRDEFWQGDTAGRALRTAFVVGDKKQSIYSFQGADARLFDRERQRMAQAAASHGFENRSLFLSFRSATTVLETVDEFFAGDAGDGLYTGEPELHRAAKPSLSGRVELWPMARRPEKEAVDMWSLPVDSGGTEHPHRTLAKVIAADIQDFVDNGAIDLGNGESRRPRYGDIMVLCQRRTGIFPEIVRRLSLANIPNGGTDRVKLLEDVAVRDIQSALRFAVNHDDDLSLAEFLKSPFGQFSDDDLYSLAQPRGKQRLWPALRARRSEDALGVLCAGAVDRLEPAETAGRQGGAFAFLSVLLDEGEPVGRYLLRSRLGDASDDAIDELLSEALAFDIENPRTLDGFLAYLETLSSDIKKEFDADADVVRIMTVHGAKGLEAPVVYLADAAYLGATRTGNVPLLRNGEEDGVFVRTPSKVSHPAVEEGKAYLRARDLQEYRRKFYVAATRAEQRLVICGSESGRLNKKYASPEEAEADRPPSETSWYGLAMQAFSRQEEAVHETSCLWREDMGIRILGADPPPIKMAEEPEAQAPATTPPDWLFAAAAPEHVELVSFPSSLEGEDDGPVLPPRRAGGQAGPNARERGTVIHQLLELLPSRPAADRGEAADRWLERLAPETEVAIRQEWRDEALRILEDPSFADVFGPDARAEVPIRGRVEGQVFAGQVDRLLIRPDEILVIDYKTMRPPPDDAAETPPGILRQMAIYRALLRERFPDRPVRTAILWTYAPRLMPLDVGLLDRALRPAR